MQFLCLSSFHNMFLIAEFLDILGPLELSIRFQLTPAGELATATFPGDGPDEDTRIFLTASSRVWVGYTRLFDLAVGSIRLFVRADSVDGRFFEIELAPIEIRPPTVSQLQSYLDAFYAHPDGLFFTQLALGDPEKAFKGAILASSAAGGLAYTGYDVLEIVDKITETIAMVDLEGVESINGVALSTFLVTVVPEMVSGKSQVLAATSLQAAFERTRELAGNTTDTPVEVVNKLAAFMFSGQCCPLRSERTVNVLAASSVLAEKGQIAGKSFSTDLAYCQEATTIAFQALDILDDIYLNRLMSEFSDPEIFADHSMSKVHIRIKRENRTRLAGRVYHVSGDSDSLVRVPSFPDLLGDSCIDSDVVGIQFLESNVNPYEYSNNSREIGADVTGLGVKCGNRTLPVSGLTDPVDILTRRSKNNSLAELMYVFEASEPRGNMAIFQFFVRKNHSALSIELDFPSLDLDFNNTLFPPDVTMLLRKEAPPTPEEYDWTATLPVPDEQIVSIPWTNGTNLTSNPYHWLLSPEEINITTEDVDTMKDYFIGVQLGSEQDLGSGDVVNFTLYVFETSCVYFDEDIHLWQSDGCEVGLMSNTSHIHCRCYHLTKFSGFVAPNPLNIAEALSANVLENPAGLVLVLTVFGAYLVGIVWARKSDRRDVVKAGIGILPGHRLNPRQDCQYLLTVYTGFKGNAGTTAEVTIVLYSQDHESCPFRLSDEKRILFERGSVDSFLVSTSQPLGALRFVRVWHNNGGYSPGWFLSQIVVTNRGDNTPNFFICNRWFALDRDDGQISRVLIEADPDEMKKFRNLFLAKSSRDMSDGHLWFSVAGRPARSPFTRVQRLSCCLTLLYSTMLTNIMFFGRGDDFDPPEPFRVGGIEMDPPISLPQIMIGLQSAAIIMPVNLIIVFLFRWLLVWTASFVAAFFTVLYSLSFGRAKAEAWLFTFLTSFLTDLFLIQPFKLMIVAVLFALLAKVLQSNDRF
ncbi:polycystin-1-like protein 3 [Branchiostoma floridae x Branchiostoma belcheri]